MSDLGFSDGTILIPYFATHWFCHVSRRLQRTARPECSDYAICMMPIAMRAW